MIRSRKFELKSFCNQSSWDSFSALFEHYASHKEVIEKTFAEAAFDLNFNEPMNVILLECDSRNPEASSLKNWVNKFNELFHSNEDKIVIDFATRELPLKYRKKVFFTHTWFVKNNI